jgi:hypothetical protein
MIAAVVSLWLSSSLLSGRRSGVLMVIIIVVVGSPQWRPYGYHHRCCRVAAVASLWLSSSLLSGRNFSVTNYSIILKGVHMKLELHACHDEGAVVRQWA